MFGRQEYVGIMTKPGQAKVMGTILCVGGALLLSFYHGHTINIVESSIHWTYAENMETKSSGSSSQGNFILGPFFLISSSLSWAMWFILQVSIEYSQSRLHSFNCSDEHRSKAFTKFIFIHNFSDLGYIYHVYGSSLSASFCFNSLICTNCCM